MLAALAARRPVDAKVAVVVAHPDDETIAAGGSLWLMPKLLLVHVTDGAPRRIDDAARKGFVGPSAYARARADELTLALALSGADPTRESLDIPDQEATEHFDEITDRLGRLLAYFHVDFVLTHAYEGGHPDHDAVALAVHALGLPIVEFAGYHASDTGAMVTQQFLPCDGTEVTTINLPPSDRSRRRAMLDCYQTQADILANFDPATERFRRAPAYDFSQPPHPGKLLYEQWGWMDGATWRERAARSRCVA